MMQSSLVKTVETKKKRYHVQSQSLGRADVAASRYCNEILQKRTLPHNEPELYDVHP